MLLSCVCLQKSVAMYVSSSELFLMCGEVTYVVCLGQVPHLQVEAQQSLVGVELSEVVWVVVFVILCLSEFWDYCWKSRAIRTK